MKRERALLEVTAFSQDKGTLHFASQSGAARGLSCPELPVCFLRAPSCLTHIAPHVLCRELGTDVPQPT